MKITETNLKKLGFLHKDVFIGKKNYPKVFKLNRVNKTIFVTKLNARTWEAKVLWQEVRKIKSIEDIFFLAYDSGIKVGRNQIKRDLHNLLAEE